MEDLMSKEIFDLIFNDIKEAIEDDSKGYDLDEMVSDDTYEKYFETGIVRHKVVDKSIEKANILAVFMSVVTRFSIDGESMYIKANWENQGKETMMVIKRVVPVIVQRVEYQ